MWAYVKTHTINVQRADQRARADGSMLVLLRHGVTDYRVTLSLCSSYRALESEDTVVGLRRAALDTGKARPAHGQHTAHTWGPMSISPGAVAC